MLVARPRKFAETHRGKPRSAARDWGALFYDIEISGSYQRV
jgi:hypothetical protein